MSLARNLEARQCYKVTDKTNFLGFPIDPKTGKSNGQPRPAPTGPIPCTVGYSSQTVQAYSTLLPYHLTLRALRLSSAWHSSRALMQGLMHGHLQTFKAVIRLSSRTLAKEELFPTLSPVSLIHSIAFNAFYSSRVLTVHDTNCLAVWFVDWILACYNCTPTVLWCFHTSATAMRFATAVCAVLELWVLVGLGGFTLCSTYSMWICILRIISPAIILPEKNSFMPLQ